MENQEQKEIQTLKTTIVNVLTSLQESLVVLKDLLEYELESSNEEEINFDEF